VEEFAELDRIIDNYLPDIRRHNRLRRLILDWYPGLAADEGIKVAGINSDVWISARDKVRSVTPAGKARLFRLWGRDEFLAKAEVYMKNLPDPEDRAQLYTVQNPTGPRHLHVMSKAKAAEPAA